MIKIIKKLRKRIKNKMILNKMIKILNKMVKMKMKKKKIKLTMKIMTMIKMVDY